MTTPDPPIGILLAAGGSRRMGRPKLLLPWPAPDGPRAIIAAAFDAIACVCRQVVVVVPARDDALVAALIEALGERRFGQAIPDGDEMIDSVRAGLRASLTIDEGAAALLQPADHPDVAPGTLAALLAGGTEHDNTAVMPEHDGHGGHPVLIPRRVFDDILSYNGPGGVRQFWRDHPDRCRRLQVDDPAVIHDLDTPDQYGAGV
jgi:molybdenum cofactor cytidylyltransferase